MTPTASQADAPGSPCHSPALDLAWPQWEETWPWAACETPTQVGHQTSLNAQAPVQGEGKTYTYREQSQLSSPKLRAFAPAPALCDGYWAERRSHITSCAGSSSFSSSHTPSRWWWPAHWRRHGWHSQSNPVLTPKTLGAHGLHRDTHIKTPLHDHKRLLFSLSVNLGETVKEKAEGLLPIERARETPWEK